MGNPANKRTETVQAVLIALLAALILRQFVVAAYKIPTGSMEDTLLVGDYLLVNKFIYGATSPDWIGLPFTRGSDWMIPTGWTIPEALHFRTPAVTAPTAGDVLVFKFPLNPRRDYIKRCMAIGGQLIEGRGRTVFVDGVPQPDPPTLKFTPDPLPGLTPQDFGPHRVREQHYFMMGDNRDNSSDSREWGEVPAANLVGKPLIVYLSLNEGDAPLNLFNMVRWERLGMVVK